MRTTLEIPDALFRQARMTAVEQGTTLKAVVREALEAAFRRTGEASTGRRVTEPQVRVPAHAPVLRMSPSDLAGAEADEEAGRARTR